MNLNDFFPHKVCINLDKRRDRWERMRARFAQHNIDSVIRFAALDGRTLQIPRIWDNFPGAYGCLQSHLAVVEQAREEGKQSVLIFEDDTVLDPQFSDSFSQYIKQLPADWDMVLFGGIHGRPLTSVANNIVRITHSLSTYAYALRHTIYDGFIELNRRALRVLDENTRELQKRFNCYCFMPHLAWVEEDYSNVTEERINLWWLKESLDLWGAEMDDTLSNTAAIIFHRNAGRNSTRNLSFITDYFQQKLPSVALLVVEQGDEPSVAANVLPPHCRYLLLEDPGDNNSSSSGRSRAFDTGFEQFESSKDFFIFLDSDVFTPREDIKANLLKCREYDFVSSFREIWDLNERDTQRIVNNDMRWDYNGNYQPRAKDDICSSCCIFTKRGMHMVGGWDQAGSQQGEEGRLSLKVKQGLRIYQSPNPARRLFHG
jgi:hypothetical protein